MRVAFFNHSKFTNLGVGMATVVLNSVIVYYRKIIPSLSFIFYPFTRLFLVKFFDNLAIEFQYHPHHICTSVTKLCLVVIFRTIKGDKFFFLLQFYVVCLEQSNTKRKKNEILYFIVHRKLRFCRLF